MIGSAVHAWAYHIVVTTSITETTRGSPVRSSKYASFQAVELLPDVVEYRGSAIPKESQGWAEGDICRSTAASRQCLAFAGSSLLGWLTLRLQKTLSCYQHGFVSSRLGL